MTTAASAIDPSPFLDPAFPLDPYPAIHRLRAEDPVHWVPGMGFWFVTRHDDVKRLFNDPEHVTQDRRVWEHFAPRPAGTFMRWVEDNGLFSLPPPEHTRIRKLVSAAFTPRAVRRMDEQIREVIERFAAPLRGRSGVVDFMEAFTNPIPNAVISRLTGVPPAGDDERRFRELAQAIIRGFFSFVDPKLQQEGEQAFLEIADWVRAMAKERRSTLGEDLISDLIRAQDADDRLLDDEIVILVTGIIGAGSETTALGGLVAILTLLEHPDAMERLRADRSLIPNAVLEILRHGFGGPAGLPRYAVRDFELRGKAIRKGQMLMLSFSGAQRDPALYESPDAFDIDRDVKELTVFGSGPHFCLGSHLARQEMGCMVDALLDLLPRGSRWRSDLTEYQSMAFFRRPVSCPVEIAAGEPVDRGDP